MRTSIAVQLNTGIEPKSDALKYRSWDEQWEGTKLRCGQVSQLSRTIECLRDHRFHFANNNGKEQAQMRASIAVQLNNGKEPNSDALKYRSWVEQWEGTKLRCCQVSQLSWTIECLRDYRFHFADNNGIEQAQMRTSIAVQLNNGKNKIQVRSSIAVGLNKGKELSSDAVKYRSWAEQ